MSESGDMDRGTAQFLVKWSKFFPAFNREVRRFERMLYSDILLEHDEFIDGLRTVTEALNDALAYHDRRMAMKAKIASLRVTTGRTPEEIALFNDKADALEEKFKQGRSS